MLNLPCYMVVQNICTNIFHGFVEQACALALKFKTPLNPKPYKKPMWPTKLLKWEP
jgi:hypothetical protein